MKVDVAGSATVEPSKCFELAYRAKGAVRRVRKIGEVQVMLVAKVFDSLIDLPSSH